MLRRALDCPPMSAYLFFFHSSRAVWFIRFSLYAALPLMLFCCRLYACAYAAQMLFAEARHFPRALSHDTRRAAITITTHPHVCCFILRFIDSCYLLTALYLY